MKSRLERAKELRAEIEQLFNDTDYWNSIHPDKEPIDIDPDGMLKEQLLRMEAIIFEESTIKGNV